MIRSWDKATWNGAEAGLDVWGEDVRRDSPEGCASQKLGVW